MLAIAVIGAGFGDEGKGLMTDYFVSKGDPSKTVVVRFNGGAQAGHTVVTPGGVRHVFHHFGSGTLLGAITFLSKFFIVNPVLWRKEIDELEALGIDPKVCVDRSALLTTPYDMLINQEKERLRGPKRYGSCGAGIDETVARGATPFGTTVWSTFGDLRRKLKEIRTEWVPKRMEGLEPSEKFWSRVNSDGILERFLGDARAFSHSTLPLYSDALDADNIIFEGAQGLLLDQDFTQFAPFLTTSKTGLTNVMHIARAAKIDEVVPVYVIRSYMTRHGAGPFPTEDAWIPFLDDTNVHNEFQGSLRFGRMDFDLVNEAIQRDIELNPGRGDAVMAVTHLDQASTDHYRFYLPVSYTISGPTRKNVTQWG
jgi:adenylosuccinate synthase